MHGSICRRSTKLMGMEKLLLILHHVSTTLSYIVMELRVELLRGGIKRARASYCWQILILKLSKSVSELLILLTQSDVLSFNSLELLDSHRQLMIFILELHLKWLALLSNLLDFLRVGISCHSRASSLSLARTSHYNSRSNGRSLLRSCLLSSNWLILLHSLQGVAHLVLHRVSESLWLYMSFL